jgi:hypothetical protein
MRAVGAGSLRLDPHSESAIMTVTISRLFDNYAEASQAVRDLEASGIPHKDISIVASNADSWYSGNGAATGKKDRDHDGRDDRAEGAATGAGIGATVGAGAGLLAGLGLLAIPGIGPVVAAGWLASTALGAVAGGTTGSIIGALSQAGVSDDEAQVYAEALRRGGTLVTARVPDGERARVESVLDRSAVRITDRAAAYRQAGWKSFDPNAAPYTADQVRKERAMYRTPGAI